MTNKNTTFFDTATFMKKLETELLTYNGVDENGQPYKLNPLSVMHAIELFECYFRMKTLSTTLTDTGVKILEDITTKIINDINKSDNLINIRKD